MKLLKFLHNL